MKKEYLILAALIAALCAYLVFHSENKTNYTLPDLPKVSGSDITRLNIDKNKKTISFTRIGDKWVVSRKKYPADPGKIKSMLKVMETLTLSTLASRGDALTRYDLDAKHRIEAVAENTSGVLRKIEIGKTAPTYRHTFVKIGNDKNIYYAQGDFRSDFDNDIDGFRNKKILSFNGGSIRKISVEKGKKQEVFFLKKSETEKKGVSSHKKNQSNGKIKGAVKPVKIKNTGAENWESKNGSAFNPKDIKSLVSRLADFKCTHYTDDDSKDAYKTITPLCTIILKGKKEMSLSLYTKDKNGNYPGICSENRYPFLLDSYEGDSILSKVNTLLGIKKIEKKKNSN